MKVGVLALQGAVQEHVDVLESLKVEVVLVKHKEQLKDLSGLIIPGGESTVIGKLMRRYSLDQSIQSFSKPILGTCAGLILMAKNIEGEESHLSLMDITVRRNAFGRQKESFEEKIKFGDEPVDIPVVFIRAPLILHCGKNVKILAQHNGKIVAARQNQLLAAAFHPELTEDKTVHQYFIQMIKEYD